MPLASMGTALLLNEARAQEQNPPLIDELLKQSATAPEPRPDQSPPANAESPTVAGGEAVTLPPVGDGGLTTGPAPSEAGGMIGSSQLPHDLSPWGMFVNADIVVQAVMVGLVIASVITWTIFFAKLIEIAATRRRLRRDLAKLSGALQPANVAREVTSGYLGRILRAAEVEVELSANGLKQDGVKERVASRLERLENAAGRRITRGTGVLATIGATAPFVGLFGTVWGIMNSFIGISEAQTTNLAVVAPGIAEALLATALGLVAAIPAVVIYNMFARSIGGYRALLGDASAEVQRLISRELDRASPDLMPSAGE